MTRTIAKVAARTLLLVALLAPPGAGSAQEAKPASSTSVTFGGFVSGTMYVQNQLFGLFTQGQAANTGPTPAQELTEDEWFHGGDVRNTRLSIGFSHTGEEEWSTGARLELDFFGGFGGTEPFGDEMPIPRLRLAYADIIRGGTTIRIGQTWAPIFGNFPTSLSHIAFPIGYGSAGVIGWRFPGVFVYHDPGDEAPLNLKLQVAAMAGSWAHLPGATAPERAPDRPGPGEADLFPQLEARVDVEGEAGPGPWNAYLVGHIDRKDADGVGADTEVDAFMGSAVQFGFRVRPAPVTLHGNVYYGEAIGQLLGAITQPGDITGFGGWLQAGYQLDPRFSVWAFAGFDDAEDGDDVLADGARDFNRILSAMLRYDLPGYAVGLEWLHAKTDFVGIDDATTAQQLALSVFYAF